jgi:nucleoside-diphosphate-sugar epimerase
MQPFLATSASLQAPGTILVTGGAGYIGSVLVRRLLTAGSSTPNVSAQIFNAGSSHMNHPLSALQEAILDVSPQTQLTYGSSADPRDYRVCFERIRSALAFECTVSLRAGAYEIHQQLRRHPALDPMARRYHNHTLAPRTQTRCPPATLVGVA